uniref:DNA-directed RNA polymerase V subunit 5A-like isoform X3 n=1 Tax=Nicotiana sylvestris TaxID=4096 RepID=A0A1U7V634_NICSY|nr:PREDICTED: DNA-directed RNA polymerase V subunit 5A-like isoform X3 [Nicotiana sylvestris]
MDLNGFAAMDMDAENLGPCLTSFVDDGTVESHRYFLARRTVLEMLKDRGFAIPNSEIESTLEEFREKFGQKPDIERLRISSMHRNDLSNKVLVIFCGPNAVKVNVIRSILTQIMNKESLSRLLLIIQKPMTAPAMKAVELLPFKVEIFQLPRMSQKDAIARYYGLEKGQVVKVTYSSEIIETHVTYRCVW